MLLWEDMRAAEGAGTPPKKGETNRVRLRADRLEANRLTAKSLTANRLEPNS